MQNYSETSENFWKGMSGAGGGGATPGTSVHWWDWNVNQGRDRETEIGEIQLGNRWKYNMEIDR